MFSAAKIKGETPFGIDFSAGTPKAVLVLIQAPYKTYTELVSGASVGDAVVSGGKTDRPRFGSILQNVPRNRPQDVRELCATDRDYYID